MSGSQQSYNGHALRKSLFPYVSPALNFGNYDEKVAPLPNDIRKHFQWKLSTITPLIVRRILANSNFSFTKQNSEWVGEWGKHMRSMYFKLIKEQQKINHFPGTFAIGRKDRLWKQYLQLRVKFGKRDFSYLPKTYLLPTDEKILGQVWDKLGGNARFIVKPPAAARGTGIKVINNRNQLPKIRPLLVQNYVNYPHLINGLKWDMRLYVLVGSYSPLRVYIYDEGLARFASVKYESKASTLSDNFCHLTNFSINKDSKTYIENNDINAAQGHKWSLKVLFKYLRDNLGIKVDGIWRQIVDIVVKTCISAESHVVQLMENVNSIYSCYELFGFDIMLDRNLKAWLLEVNISPSLHSTSVLDMDIKGPLVKDILNMASFHIPDVIGEKEKTYLRKRYNLELDAPICLDQRLYETKLSAEEKRKQDYYINTSREEYLDGILKDLTGDDVRVLIRSEDELHRRGRMIRVYPDVDSKRYHKYFETPRYYNMLFDAWEHKYSGQRKAGRELLQKLCSSKKHLKVPSDIATTSQEESVPIKGFEYEKQL